MADPIINKFREEAREVAAAHGAARDDKDARHDAFTSRLLTLYEGLQKTMVEYMIGEGEKVQEIKDGLARVEAKVDSFVAGFPAGDAVLHRLAHEAQIKDELKKEQFWGKMKFAFWALVMASATLWIGVVAWKAFLMGPE